MSVIIDSPEIKAIYGGPVTIPDGWELVDGKPLMLKEGDWWLATTMKPEYCAWPTSPSFLYKRLILRKVEKPAAEAPKEKVPFSRVSGGMEYISTTSTTVKDIYGQDEVTIPEGYRYVAFRVPKFGARELGLGKRTQEVIVFTQPDLTEPRIIVEKVEPVKPTYEFVIHTIETPGTWDRFRYMATTAWMGETHFYCQDLGGNGSISAKAAPALFVDADVLESALKERFPNCTVRRAKGVQQ